jgi:hypothetical protein
VDRSPSLPPQRSWHRALVVIGFIVAAWAVPTSAAIVTFSFTGTVDDYQFFGSDSNLDPFSAIPPSFGDPFSGTYTFESSTTDTNPNPSTGNYPVTGAPFALSLTLDGVTLTSGGAGGSLAINIQDSPGFDFYGVLAQLGTLSIELRLHDFTGTALSSDALPGVAPALAAFASHTVFADNSSDLEGGYQLMGGLTALSCTTGCVSGGTVPEPGTLDLIALAVCSLFVARCCAAPSKQSIPSSHL